MNKTAWLPNIYGIGAPKTAGTSLNSWMSLCTNWSVMRHDIFIKPNQTKMMLNHDNGYCRTGMLNHIDMSEHMKLRANYRKDDLYV
jgi:hypothetical protein